MTITDSDAAHLAALPEKTRAAVLGMMDRSYREGMSNAAKAVREKAAGLEVGIINQIVRQGLETCAEDIERAARTGR